MKLVIQRVQEASVSVDQEVVGKIGHGFMVLLGVSQTDTEEIADKMFQKLLKLRIFEDENGKTNLDIKSVNGELLIISQFTLYADCRKGNRPSYTNAGNPDLANELYQISGLKSVSTQERIIARLFQRRNYSSKEITG